ncbi:MAG: FliA/WhiG family RNA polymerase sigma factor [bacterium]
MCSAVAERFQASPFVEGHAALKYLPMVKAMAHRLLARMPKELDPQDLVNAGIVGLLQAMRDFDPSRNVRLQTYAYVRIRGAMLDALREHDWVPRTFRDCYKKYIQSIQKLAERLGRQPDAEEIREALGLSDEMYEAFLERARPLSFLSLEDLPLSREAIEGISKSTFSARMRDPGQSAELTEVRDHLAKAIDVLPEKERRVVQLYYYEELNMKEIGKVLGVGESRVCQIHTQALMRLKAWMQHQGYPK